MVSRLFLNTLAGILFISCTLQAIEPSALDDSWKTFSSIKIAQPKPVTLEKPKVGSYILRGAALYFLSAVAGGIIKAIYCANSSLPWWQADDRGSTVGLTAHYAGAILGALEMKKQLDTDNQRAIEKKERDEKLAAKQTELRTIIGDTSVLDAIATDNDIHMKAWLEYDRWLKDNCHATVFYANKKDFTARTPIMLAVQARSYKVLKQLLYLEYYKKQESINDRDSQGNTALHMAVAGSSYVAAKLLVENGASIAIKNNEGKIPADLIKNHDYRLKSLFPRPAAEWSSAFASASQSQSQLEPKPQEQAAEPNTKKVQPITAADCIVLGSLLGLGVLIGLLGS